jgi:hypothetical protein
MSGKPAAVTHSAKSWPNASGDVLQAPVSGYERPHSRWDFDITDRCRHGVDRVHQGLFHRDIDIIGPMAALDLDAPPIVDDLDMLRAEPRDLHPARHGLELKIRHEARLGAGARGVNTLPLAPTDRAAFQTGRLPTNRHTLPQMDPDAECPLSGIADVEADMAISTRLTHSGPSGVVGV